MKKYLEDLDVKELEIVWNNNEHIRELCRKDWENDTMFWLEDEIDTLSKALEHYDIGFYQNNHITFKHFYCRDYVNVLEVIDKVQNEYCFLPDNDNELIEKFRHDVEALNSMDICDDEKIDNQYDILDNDLKELESEFEYVFGMQTDINEVELFDYFVNCYVGNITELEEKAYYIENDYILKKHIDYIKTYN